MRVPMPCLRFSLWWGLADGSTAEAAGQQRGLFGDEGGEPFVALRLEPAPRPDDAQRAEEAPPPPEDRCRDRRHLRVTLAEGQVPAPGSHLVVERIGPAREGHQHAPARAAVQ